ncbi:MAG: hypothetical protein F2519_00805 [Actinobacteria bacterium]|uniref:Unannotated protein n=1 Tax=freshwater metagenome TaxID=449393 RepID=A0A6J6HT46_9ZZZZ|nr:hypothetical protein [Actinomycetota bacterium]MSY82014.1 hypothetical protein [Actinomycetota bacterium]MSZ45910.1 hypothetical protein [Actinomycetota bacterium]MTA04104.1 hypothetical protein [Actinomycetota bacterium]MTA22269.1 hypothetical protein [Actinomycetota bacterium]
MKISDLTSPENLPFFIAACVALGLIIFLIIYFFLRSRRRNKSTIPAVPPVPTFIEIFEIEKELYIRDPFDNSQTSIIEEPELKSIALTLIVGLREYLVKIFENPSDQHKSMEAVGKHLESAGVTPIAYTQWSQAPIQGLAARVIIKGKVRTALFGPSLAMVRNTAPMRQEIIDINESGTEAGHIVYVLAIDGLAYAVFDISHRLQEVIN